MDALTTKQKNQMYDEIADLLIKYGNNKTVKRMIIEVFHKVDNVETTKDLNNMQIVLTSLSYLLQITFPTK